MSSPEKEELSRLKKNLARQLITVADAGNVYAAKLLLDTGVQFTKQDFEFKDPHLRIDSLVNAFPKLLFKKSAKSLCAEYIVSRMFEGSSKCSDLATEVLCCATDTNNIKCLKFLIGLGLDVNGVVENSNPLISASWHDNPECVRALLKAGADPNVRLEGDNTALMKCKSLQCTKMLVENGADVNALNADGESALSLSTFSFELCKFLLEHGAKPNISGHCNTDPPLAQAIDFQDTSLVALLIGYGADYEAKDRNGDTMLTLALDSGRIEIPRLLLEHGADPRVRNDDGSTPLHRAVLQAHEANCSTKREYIRMLVENNADPDALNDSGITPLAYVVIDRSHILAETLLECGASSTGTSEEAKSPLELARVEKSELGDVFRNHFLRRRMRKIRGIVRSLLVCRRYRETFYRDKYVKLGERSFTRGKRKLEEIIERDEEKLDNHRSKRKEVAYREPSLGLKRNPGC